MDETVVAVHIIDTPDGAIQVLTGDSIESNEIISADDALDHLQEHMQLTDGQYIEEPEEEQQQQEEEEEEQQDIKQQFVADEEEEEEAYDEDGAEPLEDNDDEANDQPIEDADADDIIIAEAVVVTQYSCKFCNRRFDTIDKVKNHYLLRHNKDQSLAQRFSSGQQSNTDDNEDSEELSKKKIRPIVTNISKSKVNQMNLKVVSNTPAVKNDLKRKRGRKPTGVTRKYPCDWPGCNYVARHSVHLKDHKRTHTGEKPYRSVL